MGKIHKLSEDTVSKIAAGEVIERPAYAIKELIDNAIDAKATSIKISVEESGLKKIFIADNGTGMSKEDIQICYLPHTTSKIANSEDLAAIKSLGFRGEALASIAAISNLTIRSKVKKDKTGNLIIINNNSQPTIKPVGMSGGTEVLIEDLFYNVPARKKFLKTPRTEYRQILEIITNASLANPKINLEFLHNNNQIFFFSHKQQLADRVQTIFGEEISANIINTEWESSYLRINGFITKPQISFSTNNKMCIFINGRRVYDPLIISAVRDAYTNLLEPKHFPATVLYFNIPFEMVDVNIHPRKELVSFADQQAIYQATFEAISHTLERNNLHFHNVSWKKANTTGLAAQLLKHEVLGPSEIKKTSDAIQIHNLYLVTQTEKGIIFIDQHAAHEAILFRKFTKSFKKHRLKKETVPLSPAILLKLSVVDKEILEEHFVYFNELGFSFEDFGDGSLVVIQAPKLFADGDINGLIQEIIDDFSQGKKPREIDNKSYRMLAFLACRSAIKSGNKLTKLEIKKLLEELETTDMVYTCPHGRPVKIEFSLNEIDKIFKRK